MFESRLNTTSNNTIDLVAEERQSDSPFVDLVWRSTSTETMPFTSVAATHWSIVVSKIADTQSITIRGPETTPTIAMSPANSEYMGILFKPGTIMPKFPAIQLKNRQDITLPNCSNQSFWLNSSNWNLPDYDNVETFVDWLIRDELLYFDDDVARALNDEPTDVSQRTLQRRIKRATGLTRGTFDQIKRARYASQLLINGESLMDVTFKAGYFDQSHLIRSLKRFIGFTPQELASPERDVPLSFLYNTLFDT